MDDVKSNALDDRIEYDGLIPSHRGQMKVRFESGTEEVIPNL